MVRLKSNDTIKTIRLFLYLNELVIFSCMVLMMLQKLDHHNLLALCVNCSPDEVLNVLQRRPFAVVHEQEFACGRILRQDLTLRVS
jgi:hypothetical protein